MRSLPRVSSWCLAVSLALLVGCGKKADEGQAKAKPDAGKPDAVGKDEKAGPPPVPAADGGVADGQGEAGEDKSCDPSEKGECLEGETCIGKQGCDATWECDAAISCKKGTREYCGCDGKTFEAPFGNCPSAKYKYAGPCK
ncbi:hypothetical protein ACNOYE_35350 [Nannocystaceae bacterium ST9]